MIRRPHASTRPKPPRLRPRLIPKVEVEHVRVKIRVQPNGRVSRRDAATYLDKSPSTLAAWACRKIGPKVYKNGGRAEYDWEELQAM